ncbi:hypothetical protein [uncultured Vagococcus sp.]|nr:hypothetical protein [uncultured Vagococcus sp.]
MKQKKYDQYLIEERFADLEIGRTVSEKEMIEAFGDYGWGESYDSLF